MKIFTLLLALGTLGKNYQYKTQIAFDKNLYIFQMEIPLWEVGVMMVINQNILFQNHRNTQV